MSTPLRAIDGAGDRGVRWSLYDEADGGIVRSSGNAQLPLTNFTARIVAEREEDDGLDRHVFFEIEAQCKGGAARRVWVPAGEFASLSWVVRELGARAIVAAGQGTKDHVRAAIQHLSGEPATSHVYSHTGWRSLDRGYAYLHAGGAVDGDNVQPEMALRPPLDQFELPAPPEGDELGQAVRASLALLRLAPLRVTVPLFGAVWRAVLGSPDFALWLTGPTGTGKSELAALAQQHFGAALDARHLPGSWLSTGNALGELAFLAKDALLVIDDFAPSGTSQDVARSHREVERVLRAQGNAAGRARLRADGGLRNARPPRGLILGTGEEVPRGHSIRARLLVLELGPDDLQFDALSEAQARAAAGVNAAALAGFLRYVAARYDEIAARKRDEVHRLRARAASSGSAHRRTPAIVAELAFAWNVFIEFARAADACTAEEADALTPVVWAALGEAAAAQAVQQLAAEPAGRFLALLSAAIVSGRAYVTDVHGAAPDEAAQWGWRYGGGGQAWEPSGARIGWLDGSDLYLEPNASHAVAQRLASEQGESLAVDPLTLRRRLDQHGHLVRPGGARRELTVRKSIEGARQTVLHLRASSVVDRAPRATSWATDGRLSDHDSPTENVGNSWQPRLVGDLGDFFTGRET